MAYDVFISHSTKDKPFADAICAGLEAKGIRCWIAPRDVTPGLSWSQAIVEAVEECSVFLLVLTSNANSSKQAINEVDLAVNHNKTIIPFRLEDFKPTGSMEYFLGNLHWLDALTPHLEEHIKILADYILKVKEASSSKDQKLSETVTPTPELKKATVIEKPAVALKSKPEKKRTAGFLRIAVIAGIVVVAGIVTAILLLNGKKQAANPVIVTETAAQAVTATNIPPTQTLTIEPTKSEPVIAPVPVEPVPTPTETLGIGSTQTSTKDGMSQVYVPAGVFTMGSDSGQSDEKPVIQVQLSAFWIDTTEVTNAMYNKCVRDKICTKPIHLASATIADYFTNSSFADFPVIQVSYADAKAYCEWTGRRLPTEAEWEKAARGTEANLYPWGEAAPVCSSVNYLGCQNDTAKVGSYPKGASIYGALDMAGNVFEWVSDWYLQGYYDSSPLVDPIGPADGTFRIARGGAWNSNENGIRTSNRTMLDPNNLSNNVGFRCVSSAN
jgi:formylglycine-generating enzyme required for sulfatase activity